MVKKFIGKSLFFFLNKRTLLLFLQEIPVHMLLFFIVEDDYFPTLSSTTAISSAVSP